MEEGSFNQGFQRTHGPCEDLLSEKGFRYSQIVLRECLSSLNVSIQFGRE